MPLMFLRVQRTDVRSQHLAGQPQPARITDIDHDSETLAPSAAAMLDQPFSGPWRFMLGARCSVRHVSSSAREETLNGLGELIGQRRHELGMSLRALAGVSGVSYSWLSKLERGHAIAVPGVAKLVGLAEALDLTLAELLIASGVAPSLVLPPPSRYRRLRSSAGI